LIFVIKNKSRGRSGNINTKMALNWLPQRKSFRFQALSFGLVGKSVGSWRLPVAVGKIIRLVGDCEL